MLPKFLPASMTGLLLLTLMFPAAQAVVPFLSEGWGAHGSHEPSSAYDSPSFMWRSAPGDATNRLYFNVFTEQAYVWANPNVGALHTRHESVANEYHEAILGRWIDCNRDGYVGMLETAVREYSSALLFDTSVCPPTTGPAGSWSGAPNYNGWVTELAPIAPQWYSGGDDRVFRDPGVRVWGDIGYPGETATQPTCVFDSLPAGGARSTGRLLDHADCYLEIVLGTRSSRENDAAADAVRDASGLDVVGEAGSLAGSPLRARGGWSGSGHPLDQETLGDEGDPSHVTIFDCSEWNPTWITRDEPPGDDFDHLYLESVGTPAFHEEGSLAGTAVYARRAVAQNTDDGGSPCGWADEGYAEYFDYRDSPYALLEGSAGDIEVGQKDGADWNFLYHAQARGSGVAQRLGPGDAGAAPDLGLEPLAVVTDSTDDYGSYPSRWYADHINLRKLPVVARASLDGVTADLPSGQAFTFYAYVGPTTSARGFSTPGATGTYGAEACGSFTEGIHRGWQCDGSLWYPEYGGTSPWSSYKLTTIGHPYQLRDVDCYDGGNALGVGITPAFYGPRACS